jgi:hypothetical protein
MWGAFNRFPIYVKLTNFGSFSSSFHGPVDRIPGVIRKLGLKHMNHITSAGRTFNVFATVRIFRYSRFSLAKKRRVEIQGNR